MVSVVSLWLPILLSAVVVFILSSIIHMALKYHNSDYKRLSDEDKVMELVSPPETICSPTPLTARKEIQRNLKIK
jgi:hypothetical protein